MPDYQQRPEGTDAEGEQVLCVLTWRLTSAEGRRTGTHFTALGFIWHGENTATWKTLNSWLCPQGAPLGDRERVCAADRAQLFQDLTDTQASVFSVSLMSLTS